MYCPSQSRTTNCMFEESGNTVLGYMHHITSHLSKICPEKCIIKENLVLQLQKHFCSTQWCIIWSIWFTYLAAMSSEIFHVQVSAHAVPTYTRRFPHKTFGQNSFRASIKLLRANAFYPFSTISIRFQTKYKRRKRSNSFFY